MRSPNKSLVNVLFFVFVSAGFLVTAQDAKLHYRQSYSRWKRKYSDVRANQNKFSFTFKVNGDFSTFDEDTLVGVTIGDLPVCQYLGEDAVDTGFTTIGEALSMASDGPVRCKIDGEKGRGRIFGYVSQTKTVSSGYNDVTQRIERLRINWNQKRLRVKVVLQETYDDDSTPLVETMPADFGELKQFDPNPFELPMDPVVVYFGDKVYATADDIVLTGRKYFNEKNILWKANGSLKNVTISSSSGAVMSMVVSPDDEENDNVGGSATPRAGHDYELVSGLATPISAVPEDGYEFVGWTADANAEFADASSASTMVTLSGDATVTANFLYNAYLTMAVSPESGGSTEPTAGETTTEVITEPVTITATPADNYHFSSWTANANAEFADANSASTTVTLSGDATVTANFTRDTAIITVLSSPTDGGSTSPFSGSVLANTNDQHAITATAADNYHFASWSITGEGEIADPTLASTTVSFSAAVTVTANFERNTSALTMVVTPDGAGTTSPTAGTHDVEVAVKQSIVATAATGYQFVGWTSDGDVTIDNDNLATTSIVVTGEATVTANFEPDTGTAQLEMLVSPNAGGATNPGAGATHSVAINKARTITATAADGYHFSNWSITGEGTIANDKFKETTVTLTGNATVTANFSGNTGTAVLTLAVSPNGGGTVNPGAGTHTVQQGEPQMIAATAASGYEFSSWTVTGSATVDSATTASTAVTLTGDATVTAVFATK